MLLSASYDMFSVASWKDHRAICRKFLFWHRGLPIINPYTQAYAWWCAYLLFMDATYTAFVVPIGVGFNTSSVQWNWVGYWDFIAGNVYDDATCAVMQCAFLPTETDLSSVAAVESLLLLLVHMPSGA